MAMSMRHAAVIAICLWLVALIYVSTSLYGIQYKPDGASGGLEEKLDEALRGIQELKRQNRQLKELAEAARADNARFPRRKGPPNRGSKEGMFSIDHEELRRTLNDRIWEAFYYSKSHVTAEKNGKEVQEHLQNQLISLLALSSNFSSVDGSVEWRREGLRNLTNHIQAHIHKLQNPDDCSKAKILLCDLDKQCGFGCQLHHAAYCFIVAFGEQRTMVFEKDGRDWRYSRSGWNSTFLPVSSCTAEAALAGSNRGSYSPGAIDRVVSLPIVDALISPPKFLPLVFPSSIAAPLRTFHSNPPVFFVGQFLWYLMRSREPLEKHLESVSKEIQFEKGPIVGIQVRRTDKIGTEAAFHSIDEYMNWVEIWFKVQDAQTGHRVDRRVFIATDDATVIPEAKKKYPSYAVLGDIKVAQGASVNSRYTDSALLGVVADIHVLSRCNYLVCTFSSQVCRMGYELAQIRQGLSGEEFHSLDDIYYYGGQLAHEQMAIQAHVPENKDEIELEVGDEVGIAGNHWDGYSKGTNRRTGKIGLYPSYKVTEKWRIVDFPALPPL